MAGDACRGINVSVGVVLLAAAERGRAERLTSSGRDAGYTRTCMVQVGEVNCYGTDIGVRYDRKRQTVANHLRHRGGRCSMKRTGPCSQVLEQLFFSPRNRGGISWS